MQRQRFVWLAVIGGVAVGVFINLASGRIETAAAAFAGDYSEWSSGLRSGLSALAFLAISVGITRKIVEGALNFRWTPRRQGAPPVDALILAVSRPSRDSGPRLDWTNDDLKILAAAIKDDPQRLLETREGAPASRDDPLAALADPGSALYQEPDGPKVEFDKLSWTVAFHLLL